MIEQRVTGPFRGYYIAAYAGQMGDLGKEFLGFYKIARSADVTYWSAEKIVDEGCTSSVFTCPVQAMSTAEELARGQISSYGSVRPISAMSAGFAESTQ